MSQYNVDWCELLLRVRNRSDRSLAWIARTVAAMDERTINRLSRGESIEPKWSQGMALLDFAADYLTDQDWIAVRRGS